LEPGENTTKEHVTPVMIDRQEDTGTEKKCFSQPHSVRKKGGMSEKVGKVV